MVTPAPPLLQLRDITVSFPAGRKVLMKGKAVPERFYAVRGVSLSVERGATVGLVGESGCGKTTLGRAVAQMQKIDRGTILFDGNDIARLSKRELRSVRRRMQMVFQNPFASLNPRMTVFDAVAEAARTAAVQPPVKIAEHVALMLEQVGLDAAMMRKFPHEFSGGQRQRIAIARALAAQPALVIADEPVSSLDVSVAAQILNLLYGLRDRLGLTMLFISHDLSVVRYIAHFIAVMYQGRIVEYGPAETVFASPGHPYTAMLLQSVPVIPDSPEAVPFFKNIPFRENTAPVATGCPFAPRCGFAIEECYRVEPKLLTFNSEVSHRCACYRAGELSL
jgi:oligopeptide/dipeptide ABC transporter ATP-binding protein